MNCNEKEDIDYIWQNYSTENHFELLNEYSIKEAEQHGNHISVNPLARFSQIFASADYLDDDILNVLFHYLAHLDILCGYFLTHGCKNLFANEILEGRYGTELCENFSKLNAKDRDIIAIYLQKYYQSGEKREYFNDVFFDFFGRTNNLYNEDFDAGYTKLSAEIYYQRSTNIFYYFCAAEESEYNKMRFSVARSLFADFTKNIRPIWGKYCFGIIDGEHQGYAAVPVINEMQIV